ncbi:hypothetical protein DY000_02010221 [Brassica cretica]|uniref:Uncharacterized protein n=1 Tax=Brassica cretica TaxID=69181 RepID=A0ABQ7C5S2_BRACR|nr:hypothetical protein DY000_02010221 [Brassica cretica]
MPSLLSKEHLIPASSIGMLFVCKQRTQWRCVKCPMAAHNKHAPWPQEILHMKTNQEEQSAAELLRDQTIRCACDSITASSYVVP